MARAVDPTDAPSRRRLYREAGPGERWWFAVLLLPALLTALVVVARGDSIEADLQKRTMTALQSAGLENTQVEMSGRSAILRVPTGEDQNTALDAAHTVAGIGEVTVEHVARNAREARACDNLQTKIDNAGKGRGIQFAGASTTMTSAGAAATRAIAKLLVNCPSAVVVAEGHTDGGVIGGSTISLRRAEVVRAALARAGTKAKRTDVKGFGDTYPASTADTDAARALNNRVVVTVKGD